MRWGDAAWICAAALPALLLVGAARAQPAGGVYVGLGGGYSLLQDEHLRPSTSLGLPRGRLAFSGGGAGQVSLGYGLGTGLRLEVEGSYRGNGLADGASGSREGYGLMANALFDFDVGAGVFPYVGIGAGYQWRQWSGLRAFTGGGGIASDDSGAGFAYQGILGAAIPVPSLPGLSVTAEYRLLGMPGGERFRASLYPSGGASGREAIADTLDHQFMLGLRYSFAAAPRQAAAEAAPAPLQAPGPAPARTYLVFFDWDRAELTDRARQIVAEAAGASTRVAYTRIEVDGYADRSGSPGPNRSLSLRRAEVVAAELVRDGVPPSVIQIQGFGETRPLVPTAPGVRAPQNRRVEIVLH